MNLPQFLSQVDSITKQLSKEDLEGFIHRNARMVPEHLREAYLSGLKGLAGEELGNPSTKDSSPKENENLQETLEQVFHALEQIDDGEFSLESTYNEEYDDWYNNSTEEFLFEDPQNVLPIIQLGCDLVHRCMDSELYREAYRLADALLAMKIHVTGDYEDCLDDDMNLHSLDSYELIQIDTQTWLREALLAAYLAHPMEQRPEILYRMVMQAESPRELFLAPLIENYGALLTELENFLPLWLHYLGQQESAEAEYLLAEAVRLIPSNQVLEAARTFSQHHPILYEKLLEEKNGDLSEKERYALGQEAMEAISPCYRIRGRIALLTAECALQMGQKEDAVRCWLEAFRSDTTPLNYFRLAVESEDFSGQQEEMRQMVQTFGDVAEKHAYDYETSYGELAKNSVGMNDYYLMLFLDGQFEEVLRRAMNAKEPLGWSSTFMKQGLAYFLLYLFQADTLEAGCLRMCNSAREKLRFSTATYEKGLLPIPEQDDNVLFWECFRKWREKIPMPENIQRQVLSQLEQWIRMRTEGIVGGQRRNYYGECAAYIAALGEVKESRGEPGAKSAVFAEYCERYPRHSAFHKELQAFGMIGGKGRKG